MFCIGIAHHVVQHEVVSSRRPRFAAMPHPRDLSVSSVLYDLPADRIAQHPPADRGSSRLLVYRDGVIEDRIFADLPRCCPPGPCW